MNSFQRKSLYAALAGAGALGVTATADAVQVNPNGLGQVLIYPYYTVQSDAAGNAYNSLLTVVNTDASAKAVKVRFLEGRRSQEVLDFNLFLSKFDVWTAAIEPTTAGGAKITTTDNSCTIPVNTLLKAGVNFVNFAYAGDGGGDGLDRTKEGYVEIIEMATYTSTNCTSIVVTHVNSVPECQGAKHPLNDTSAKTDASDTAGGLFGSMVLINVGTGREFSEDAVALERFNQVSGGALYFNAGSISPALDLVDAAEGSNVFNGLGFRGGRNSGVTEFNSDGTIASSTNYLVDGDAGIYTSFWDARQCGTTGTVADTCKPVDAVSAVLMHSQVMNDFVLDAVTKSGTDWVITFPTKRFYVATGTGSASKLFQRNFNKTDFSCDDVIINIYDREENTITTPQSFSPPQPGGKPTSLCFEANVLTFGGSYVLGLGPIVDGTSTIGNRANLGTGFEHGWLDIHLSAATNVSYHKLINTHTFHAFNAVAAGVAAAHTYQGLPVVGFAVETFNNGALVINGVNELANYGGNFVHKYVTLIN